MNEQQYKLAEYIQTLFKSEAIPKDATAQDILNVIQEDLTVLEGKVK